MNATDTADDPRAITAVGDSVTSREPTVDAKPSLAICDETMEEKGKRKREEITESRCAKCEVVDEAAVSCNKCDKLYCTNCIWEACGCETEKSEKQENTTRNDLAPPPQRYRITEPDRIG